MKSGMSLRYAIGRFVFELSKIIENQMDDDVIVTSFYFPPNNCPYFKFYWTYNLILGTNIQHHTVHLMINIKMPLKDTEGHRWRSKTDIKNKLMVKSRKLSYSQTSYLVPRNNTISGIEWHKLFWPWRKVKVTRRGPRSQTWRCLLSLNASCTKFSLRILYDYLYCLNSQNVHKC